MKRASKGPAQTRGGVGKREGPLQQQRSDKTGPISAIIPTPQAPVGKREGGREGGRGRKGERGERERARISSNERERGLGHLGRSKKL